MKSKNGKIDIYITIILLYFCIFCVCIIGYCSNIYKLITADWKDPYKNEIIRAIGVPVAPIGVIVGYMDLED